MNSQLTEYDVQNILLQKMKQKTKKGEKFHNIIGFLENYMIPSKWSALVLIYYVVCVAFVYF